MQKIRIAVVDDHDLFREGILLVLGQIEGFEVVYNTADGHRFLEAIGTMGADVALMDVEMPAISGATVTREALAIRPDLRTPAHLLQDRGIAPLHPLPQGRGKKCGRTHCLGSS